jgi:hypothetical protein
MQHSKMSCSTCQRPIIFIVVVFWELWNELLRIQNLPDQIVRKSMQKHHHDCSNAETCRASLDVQCSEDNPQPKSHNHTAVWCKKQWSTTHIVHHERRCHGFHPIGSRIDAVDLVLE